MSSIVNPKYIFLSSTVDTGGTNFACDYLRNFPLQDLCEVAITPIEHDAINVTFYFMVPSGMFYSISIPNAFCVGYGGEGPSGLYEIMREAGFPEETSMQVFSLSRYNEAVLHK